MSVWRNEEDFMTNMDNMLSEFYIKDKKVTTPKKLNIQTRKQSKSWYDSDSDDDESDFTVTGDKSVSDSNKCPSMEPLDTLQLMESIRSQVRNVVGDRYNNEVLETYYKMEQQADEQQTLKAVPFVQPQVTDTSKVKTQLPSSVIEEPVASSSKLNGTNNIKSKFSNRRNHNTNTRGNRGSSRYHNNVAFSSFQNKESYNYKSKDEFPPL